jgi:hypothetical protein
MTLSQQEYEGIINDTTKVINENIDWEGASGMPTRQSSSTSNPTMDIPSL